MSAASLRGRGTLRTRLLIAFALVSVPPLILLATSADVLLSGRVERSMQLRLDAALERAQSVLDARRTQAGSRVEAALRALPESNGDEADRFAADVLARDHGLPLLEIVDTRGRVVSSAHWPAGFDLPDADFAYPGEGAFRLETVAHGPGSAETLALMPARGGRWRGRTVVARGGPRLDAEFLRELSALLGAEVAIRDADRRLWFAARESPVLAWEPPAATRERGSVELIGGRYDFVTTPLAEGLVLVAAMPALEAAAVTRDLRRLTVALGAAALLGGLLAAFVLSGRVAGPVRELVRGARRVAAGDLDARVASAGPRELRELALSFNRMTEELAHSRERLLQVERVAAWREMARRLAHELKNPLFPIQLSVETLRRQVERLEATRDGETELRTLVRESTDTLLTEIKSLAGIVDEFSRFARMPQPEKRPTVVGDVVQRVVDLYRARAAESKVGIDVQLDPGLPPISADAELLARALGNLVANALDAMPHGGSLRVRSAQRERTLLLELRDTGPGLDAEQQARLFTPYFTTKTTGTGLGLAIVQGIVSDHGGRIEVKSAPGAGATFTVVLPV